MSLNKFREFTDGEGYVYIALDQISYFYFDEEYGKVAICCNNGTVLYINESLEYVLNLVKWV